MKNIKLYAILGLCFGMLFLTGCGGGDSTPTLTCTQDMDGGKVSVKMMYDKDEKKPQNTEVTLQIEIPDDVTDEMVEMLMESYKDNFCTNDSLKCDVKEKNGLC